MPKGIYILVFQLTAQEINTLKVILYQVNCNVTTLQFSENLWYIYSRFIYKCTIVYILFSYLDKYMSLSTEQLLECLSLQILLIYIVNLLHLPFLTRMSFSDIIICTMDFCIGIDWYIG